LLDNKYFISLVNMVLGNGQWNPDSPSADFANKNHQEKDKTVITDSNKMEKKFLTST